MNSLTRNFVLIILSLLLIAGVMSTVINKDSAPQEVGVATLIEGLEKDQIKKIEVLGDTLLAYPKDEKAKTLEVKKEFGQSFSELMKDYGVNPEKIKTVDVKIKEETGWRAVLSGIAPYILPLLIVGALIFFLTRQVQGANNRAMGFGQSSAKQVKPDDQHKKTFADVAGAKEAKDELEEIVDFLKNPKKFSDMGAKIPKGVLLMGSPGTGKTLLAKAVAGEANVPFFHMSGSEFVEMFVGVGASRVRDLFQKAKKAAPAIIFIDEIDAVGRKRGAGLGGSHDEREQTLNQILVEMDGFDPHIGVIVMAATNRPDVLDQALLRPGRFDRRVVIDMPDISDREEILKVHAVGKPLSSDVNLHILAERTPGFSGADLGNLLNEAAILAVRKGKKEINEVDVRESIDKVILGPEKRSRVMTEHDKKMTAYHEAGHAIVGHFSTHCDPVRKISIIGRGMAGGYTLSMPVSDQHYQTILHFKDDMAMMMGGYVAERMIYGDDNLSTGPSSDLKKATQMATAMVTRYGMSDKMGPRVFAQNEEMIFLAQEIHDKKNYSEKTAQMIDEEVSRLLEEAKVQASKILTEKRPIMEKLVTALIEKETIEQEEFKVLMGTEVKKENVNSVGMDIVE
ncbi:MAG: cell division protein FtsH [Candidatus Magasanikbacteria bacterium RIFCSPHIGHO2_02_FULL_41_13]|uniref:ATP-dependent zinc metalloprotease FtsH n=1 Tax=Candidatus Magasanikbacteria bacterium RIFCSPHIGHO2_02_FULL_41_13 TaxID=1798676 RepID=A0A1F6M468_9BACT|nr:MAG: cell division protein FtsH [Candidatus Magasanikbacteria bacterium RIFCSPHIGHO2_02_FULL_41_13]